MSWPRVPPSMRGQAGHAARVKQAVERMAPGSASGRAVVASPARPKAAVAATKTSPIETVRTVAASGSTETLVDVTAATIHYVTLTANCTFTFPTAGAGKSFTVVLVQDGTGSRTATWPASVKWAAGASPTLTTTAAKRDVFSFMCADGSTWIGFTAAQNVA